MAVAEVGDLFLGELIGMVPVVEDHEVVAGSVHFGERNDHASISVLMANFQVANAAR